MTHAEQVRALRQKSWAINQRPADSYTPLLTALEHANITLKGMTHSHLRYLEKKYAIKKYNPNQPRVPAGSSEGGQWASGGAGGAGIIVGENSNPGNPTPDPGRAEPIYPLETILGGLYGRQIYTAIRGALYFWRRGESASSGQYQQATKSIENFFGGPPDKTFPNSDGDIIMMGGGKKLRFDLKNPHGYDPHFHVERYDPKTGKWIDSCDQHMYFFKKE